MFDPGQTPAQRLYALAPGVDFAAELVAGLRARLAGAPPEAMARVTVIVNTRRMQRRLTEVFQRGPAGLLPRLVLVTDPGGPPPPGPAEVPELVRRLELAAAVGALIEAQPDLAARSARFDLAQSLADLMDEMAGEGVPPGALAGLDVGTHADHWARALLFLDAMARGWADAPGAAAAERARAEYLARSWAANPPADPVIVAGSTGSRGATALLIRAVAGLPQGALVLPGFDFDMPGAAWAALGHGHGQGLGAEDHPQYRFHALLSAIGAVPGDVQPWTAARPPAPARNKVVSLALRPAPVTDAWLAEAPDADTAADAARGLTLIEAPDARAEALAIALCLRQAAGDGIRAALITADRTLARRVTAALDRWRIRPDDSAGEPLGQSPPGRFLRLVAAIMGTRLDAETLLSLLKHPLIHSGGGDDRHGLYTARLEARLRRFGPAFPTGDALRAQAPDATEAPEEAAWTFWLAGLLDRAADAGTGPLSDRVATHRTLAEALAAGPVAAGTGRLWDGDAGAAAALAMDMLAEAAPEGGIVTAEDHVALLDSVLAAGEVRSAVEGHPRIAIQGTLEARAGGVDLAILGGLNEGSWPALPGPDPWLNRAMRRDLGLLLPERRIGLAAHDFQQAVCLPRVILTRARRDDEAETLPARWLTRLTGLLGGSGPGGKAALEAMRDRGADWLRLARMLDAPSRGERDTPELRPAPRPAPRPPVAVRPRELPVTRIATLVRDPYAVYARHVLGLRPLDPLRAAPDPPLRGIVLHHALARFVEQTRDGLPDPETARALLLRCAREALAEAVPWPAARRQWLAGLAAVADGFLRDEARRRAEAAPAGTERRGGADIAGAGFRLTAVADRIDRRPDGALIIYDYKTGKPPTPKQVRDGDRQLPLEGAIAERGGFVGVDGAPVAGLRYIGLGVGAGQTELIADRPIDDELIDDERIEDRLIDESWAGLGRLIAAWQRRDTGYAARARLGRKAPDGDYDHLARRGEWDDGDAPQPEDVG